MASYVVRFALGPTAPAPEVIEERLPAKGTVLYAGEDGRLEIAAEIESTSLVMAVARLTAEAFGWKLPIRYLEAMTAEEWDRRVEAAEATSGSPS